MGLFSSFIGKIIGKGSKQSPKNASASVLSLAPASGNFTGSAETNAVYQTCISASARISAKVQASLYLGEKEVNDRKELMSLLNLRPNKVQSSVNFWKQFWFNFYKNNMAIIYIQKKRSQIGTPIEALWVIDPTSSTFSYGNADDGTPVFSFRLNAEKITCFEEDLIILARNTSAENPYVTNNKALRNNLMLIDKNFEGLEKTINTARTLRFIAQSVTPLKDDVIKKRQAFFNNSINEANGSLAYIDGAQSVQQITNDQGWTGTDDVQHFEDQIYDWFGIPKSIVNGSATDDVYQSYVEETIEPAMMELEQELTYKLFTTREIQGGRHIRMDTMDLFTASLSHRTAAVNALISSGKYRSNEIRGLLGLTKLPDEEDEIINRIDRIDSKKGEDNDGNQGEQDEPQ